MLTLAVASQAAYVPFPYAAAPYYAGFPYAGYPYGYPASYTAQSAAFAYAPGFVAGHPAAYYDDGHYVAAPAHYAVPAAVPVAAEG